MSLRDEVYKLIDIEREKLTQRDVLLAKREEQKTTIFYPVKSMIAEILSAAPEFAQATYHSTRAWIKIGRDLPSGRTAEITLTVRIDFEREYPTHSDRAPYFTVEEERYYDFSGFQPSETSISKKKFTTEAELAEYLAGTFVKIVASARHSAQLKEKSKRQYEPNKAAEATPVSVTSPAKQEP
jgi:hypothetical protein